MEPKDREDAERRPQKAGNAQFDPTNQTTRRDMPEEEQESGGPAARGTAPSKDVDRSNQPHRTDRQASERPAKE
jgi:hypothetical protein